MKITVSQLKKLIREQVEEMSDMGGATEGRDWPQIRRPPVDKDDPLGYGQQEREHVELELKIKYRKAVKLVVKRFGIEALENLIEDDNFESARIKLFDLVEKAL